MTLRYKVPVCYISEGDTRKTVESCLSYLTEVSEKAYRTLMAKYGDVFQQIQERLDSDLDDEERDRQEKKHYLFKIYQQLERHLKELPVVGFNSGKYDVNAMKVDFFAELVKSQMIKYTVKRNNNFMCIKTEALKFLDITNYMALGFSYS
jgi:uroporphyrinogen-III decarboxylase